MPFFNNFELCKNYFPKHFERKLVLTLRKNENVFAWTQWRRHELKLKRLFFFIF